MSSKKDSMCVGFGITPMDLHNVFPYHILIGSDMKIKQIGGALANVISGISSHSDKKEYFSNHTLIGESIENLFKITSPPKLCWDWNHIKLSQKCTFEMELSDLSRIKKSGVKSLPLRGGVLILNPRLDPNTTINGALFLTSLRFQDHNMLINDGYNLSDISRYTYQREAFIINEHLKSELNASHRLDLVRKELKHEEEKSQHLLEMKKCFVRYVSHEIRTPLNVLTMGLRLLEDNVQKMMMAEDDVPDSHNCDENRGNGGGGCMSDTKSEVSIGTNTTTTTTMLHTPTKCQHKEDTHISSLQLEKETILDLVKDMLESTASAAGTLNDLLIYDNIENNMFHIEPTYTSLSDLVSNIVYDMEPLAHKSQINFSWDLSSLENVYVFVDITQINQVLRNLISTVLKFTSSDNNIHVSCITIEYDQTESIALFSRSNKRLSLRRNSLKNGNNATQEISLSFIRIMITDSGISLSQDECDKIFDEIKPTKMGKLNIVDNSGFSLWVAKKVMEAHGGSIGVDSNPLQGGSTFYMDIPIVDSQIHALPVTSSIEESTIPVRREEVSTNASYAGSTCKNEMTCYVSPEIFSIPTSIIPEVMTQPRHDAVCNLSTHTIPEYDLVDKVLNKQSSMYINMNTIDNILTARSDLTMTYRESVDDILTNNQAHFDMPSSNKTTFVENSMIAKSSTHVIRLPDICDINMNECDIIEKENRKEGYFRFSSLSDDSRDITINDTSYHGDSVTSTHIKNQNKLTPRPRPPSTPLASHKSPQVYKRQIIPQESEKNHTDRSLSTSSMLDSKSCNSNLGYTDVIVKSKLLTLQYQSNQNSTSRPENDIAVSSNDHCQGGEMKLDFCIMNKLTGDTDTDIDTFQMTATTRSIDSNTLLSVSTDTTTTTTTATGTTCLTNHSAASLLLDDGSPVFIEAKLKDISPITQALSDNLMKSSQVVSQQQQMTTDHSNQSFINSDSIGVPYHVEKTKLMDLTPDLLNLPSYKTHHGITSLKLDSVTLLSPCTTSKNTQRSPGRYTTSPASYSDSTIKKLTVPLESVLVVDDSASVRKVNIRFLNTVSDHINTVNEAVDGVKAYELVYKEFLLYHHTYDIIMMDLMMPNMSGTECTEKIRGLGYKGLIVGVTGNSQASDIKAFYDSGVDKVFVKPLHMNDFVDYVNQYYSARIPVYESTTPSLSVV